MTLHDTQMFEDEVGRFDEPARVSLRAPLRPESPLLAPPLAPVDEAAKANNAETPPTKPSRGLLRKTLLGAVGLLALAGSADLGWRYWTVGRFEVSTDDAYVQADNTTIAPKVSGYVGAVLVGDNQPVKAGQVLARIDDRDYRVALEQADADVASAKATVAGKQAALTTQQATIDAARATVAGDQALQTFAGQDDRRYAALASSGWGSVQAAQQAASRIGGARATVERDTAALASATKQLGVLRAELGQAQAALAHSQAVRDQAKLDLSYTTLVAPVDGVIGNRTLRVGQYVQAGTQLMSVVPTQAAYVVANFKETQLGDVVPGQSVDIAVDMYPGKLLHGRVDSLSPASGQEFALLPPDNATGNFTKVVQRIPVKITLDEANPPPFALRPGMSVDPTIDVRPVRAEPVAAQPVPADSVPADSVPAHSVPAKPVHDRTASASDD